jgi:dUTP pyrophosphatase
MSEINDLNELRDRILKLQESLHSESEEVSYEDILNEMDIDIVQLEKDMIETRRLLPLGFKVLHPNAVLPKYNYDSDSGFDLHSIDEIEIPPFGRVLVPTGLSFDIQDGYEIQVRTKSGLAINQGLMVLNSPGTVDNGYTGEVKAIIFNTNPTSVTIPKGMKVGQAVLCPVVNGGWVDLQQTNKINKKERGSNGFGSTGIFDTLK